MLGSIDAIKFDFGVGWVAHGWAFDPDRAEARLTVEIRGAEMVFGSGLAAEFRDDLLAAGIGDGAVAFKIPLQPGAVSERERHVLSLRNAADGNVIVAPTPYRLPRLLGAIERVEGILVVGWACDTARPDIPAALEMLIDGEIAGRVVADLFCRTPGGSGGARHGFEWVLPGRCADGQPHRLGASFANTGVDLESAIGEILVLPGRITQVARRLLDLRDFARQHLAALQQELRFEARGLPLAKPPTTTDRLLDSLDPAPAFDSLTTGGIEAAAIGFE